jgi:hypothetical protein
MASRLVCGVIGQLERMPASTPIASTTKDAKLARANVVRLRQDRAEKRRQTVTTGWVARASVGIRDIRSLLCFEGRYVTLPPRKIVPVRAYWIYRGATCRHIPEATSTAQPKRASTPVAPSAMNWARRKRAARSGTRSAPRHPRARRQVLDECVRDVAGIERDGREAAAIATPSGGIAKGSGLHTEGPPRRSMVAEWICA